MDDSADNHYTEECQQTQESQAAAERDCDSEQQEQVHGQCVCLWLRRPPNSSQPRRSDNAVQKISELGAMSNARQNIDRMACRFVIPSLP
jgi:hypothetical protein